MSWTHVANSSSQANSSSSATISLTYGSNVTAGDLLIAAVTVDGGSPTSVSVADDKGNSWSQAVASAKQNSTFVAIWWAVAGGGNTPKVTATPNTGTPFLELAIHEFSPGSPATSFTIAKDGTNSGTGTNTANPSAGSISVAGSGRMVFACFGEGNVNLSSVSAGSGFTLDQSGLTGATSFGYGTEFELNVSSAQTGAFTVSTTSNWCAAGASFSATASGGGAAGQLLAMIGCGA